MTKNDKNDSACVCVCVCVCVCSGAGTLWGDEVFGGQALFVMNGLPPPKKKKKK